MSGGQHSLIVSPSALTSCTTRTEPVDEIEEILNESGILFE